jgi:hypothetical protein
MFCGGNTTAGGACQKSPQKSMLSITVLRNAFTAALLRPLAGVARRVQLGITYLGVE